MLLLVMHQLLKRLRLLLRLLPHWLIHRQWRPLMLLRLLLHQQKIR